MEDLLVHNFIVNSRNKDYTVAFDDNFLNADIAALGSHFIVDANVIQHLGLEFYQAAHQKSIYILHATEENKSYNQIGKVIDHLLVNNLKRDSHLVAIGGGITQDITCFVASTFMRGINWTFVPTTLLAQADSCIGSKSSINFGNYKNLLGTFNPPDQVFICNKFLTSLSRHDFYSGIGEIVKLFLLDNQDICVDNITTANVSEYVSAALQIKKKYIEVDEFDRGIRNLLNYGHCVGHAIESATNFAIPHGIAIAMGMDIVNKFAHEQNLIREDRYRQLNKIIYPCYQDFADHSINLDRVLPALFKDKKNTGNMLNLILPVNEGFAKQGFERNKQILDSLLGCFQFNPA
jgi:3-dehydroquinate synthase